MTSPCEPGHAAAVFAAANSAAHFCLTWVACRSDSPVIACGHDVRIELEAAS